MISATVRIRIRGSPRAPWLSRASESSLEFTHGLTHGLARDSVSGFRVARDSDAQIRTTVTLPQPPDATVTGFDQSSNRLQRPRLRLISGQIRPSGRFDKSSVSRWMRLKQ
jgi:hypothetical protein